MRKIIIITCLLNTGLLLSAQDKNHQIYLCLGNADTHTAAQHGKQAKHQQDATTFEECFKRTLKDNLPKRTKIDIIGSPIVINGTYGEPYNALLETAREAQKKGIIRGILLMPENTARNGKWRSWVKEVYNRLLNDLDLKASDVPLLAGETADTKKSRSINTLVNRLTRTINTAHIVPSDGCPVTADSLHLTAQGYQIMGRRFAAQVLRLQGHDTEVDDGTFSNPVIWADVPDPDVIRVGDDFYMVSTTMHLMPGAPIMHSKDLVNWRIVNYVFDTLNDTPKYDMEDGTVYGCGQWATSLRYHDGTFYLYFSPNDAPYKGYVYTAKDPKGKWTLAARIPHFHDASLFFDDDGKAYMFHGTGRLTELKSDLSDIQPGGIDMDVFERDSTETGLLEGSRVIKHDGKYYLLMVSWPQGGKRRQVCYRADNITGPYEKRIILESEFGGFSYVGQGTIVDDADGNWYGMIFQDRGGVGRVLTLNQCRWIDGWPMIGDAGGKVAAVLPKPVLGYNDGEIVTSDDFDSSKMKLEWEWNHNPVDEAWSLTERKGYLRLKTSIPADNLFLARNTISQRMEGPECSGIVKIDISNMKDGDVAGISALQGDAAVLQIKCEGKQKILSAQTQSVKLAEGSKMVTDVNASEVFSTPLNTDIIYLRMDADFNPGKDFANLYYSTDGNRWILVMKDFKMRYDYTRLFMGTRYAIFNYATKENGGYVDVDWFKYEREIKEPDSFAAQ